MYIAFGNCSLRPLYMVFVFLDFGREYNHMCYMRVGAVTFPFIHAQLKIYIIKQTRRKEVEKPKMRIYSKVCVK
jgi:hypothetical protein